MAACSLASCAAVGATVLHRRSAARKTEEHFMDRASLGREMFGQERGDIAAAFGGTINHLGEAEIEMRHAGIDLELVRTAGGGELRRHVLGAVAQRIEFRRAEED